MIEIGLIFLAVFLVFVLAGLAKESEPGSQSAVPDTRKEGYRNIKNHPEYTKAYRLQLCRYFESQGYLIEYSGEGSRFQAKGIDIIATKFHETVLIKCENQREKDPYRIEKRSLKRFMVDCDYFLKSEPSFRNERIRKIIITPENILDSSARKFVQEYARNIEHLLIPFQKRQKAAA